ncbi:MAG TPA: hypothetical protein VF660_10870, partial [Actinomycetota bacterium]
GEVAAQTLGVSLLGRVPLVPALREGGDTGIPIVVSEPDSPAGRVFRDAARRLATETRTLVRKPLGLTVAPGARPAPDEAAHAGHAHDHAGHVH